MLMKFFRQYNKQLLAFFMALLMIVFIGGSALQGLMTPNPNPPVATSSLGGIMLKDQQRALEETHLLDAVGQNWQRPLFSEAKPLDQVDWILLLREADKLGVSVDEAAIATSPGFELQQSRLRTVAHQLRVKPELIIASMAKLEAIRKTAMAMAGAAVPSEAEIILAARNALERTSIRSILVPAEAFMKAQAEFTPAQLDAQFSAYREREKAAGLDFGYYRHPTIKVQYIKVDHAAVAANIGIPNLEKKARAYYEEQRATNRLFQRNPEELQVPDPAEQGLIVGPPAPKPAPHKDWEEVKDVAIGELRKQQADEFVQRVVDWVIPYATEAWIDAPRRDSGYKTPPATVASLDYYDRLLERLPQALRLPGAVSIQVSDFFTQEDAVKVPGIGATILRADKGLTGRNFRLMAFLNEAVVPKIPDNAGSDGADYLALFQTSSRPLSDYRSGDAYIYRVVEFRPGGPAERLDEVRDQVVADLRLKHGFEAAKARAETLRGCSESLKEAFEADSDLIAFRESGEGAKTGYLEPPPFSRVVQNQAASGRSPDGTFVGGGLARLPNDVVDAIFALADAPDKRAAFELPERAAMLVVEWVETIPAGEDEFNAMRQQLVTQLTDKRWQAFINDWLDPERIRARNGFQLAGRK